MLTPNQQEYCRQRAIKRLSQRKAYYKAYPNFKGSPKTADEKACNLEATDKIRARIKELEDKETERISNEAAWTREDARKKLTWLIEKAEEEIEAQPVMNSPAVSALINSVKELNTIYAVGEKTDSGGVLEDILSAVRGIDND